MKVKIAVFAALLAAAGCVSDVRGPVAADGEMRLMGVDLRHDASNLDRVASAIVTAAPDFVAVRDVDWYRPRSGLVDQGVELGKRTGLIATWQVLGLTDAAKGLNGLVVLSREKPKGVRLREFGDMLEHGVFACEFADCFIVASNVDRDSAEREIAKMKLSKPYYFPEDGLRAVPIPGRQVAQPALVPRPVEYTAGDGFLTFAINEGSTEYERGIRDAADASIPPEGYRLKVDANGICVTASDDAGRFYARRTLAQLLQPRWGRMVVPFCTVRDFPRYAWRGMHLDEARHFFGKAAVKRFLDQLAAHKYNVFHWHLTDNQGWTLPVARCPELARDASSRPYRSYNGFLDRFEDKVYGPNAYTADEIREVLDYAAARHICVVPEVDVPGHCRALLNVHPEFRCYDKDAPGAPTGFVDNVICLGNDEAIAFVERIFDDVADLFPGEVIHMGGDEVKRVNWENCPKCRERMRKEGLKEVNDLQAWFVQRLKKRLAAKGRRLAGWACGTGFIRGGVSYFQGHKKDFATAAAEGYDLVDDSDRYTYYIYNQCLPDDPAVYPWFSFPLSLEKAYEYDPGKLVGPANMSHVLGGQGYNWSECVPTESELQWTLFPRACATAEALWSPVEGKSFDDFLGRMKVHRKRLLNERVNCAPLPE